MSNYIIHLFENGTAQICVSVVLFLIGLGLIVKGGDLFVDSATWMAEAFGIPKFIIGATIVSVATTLPEQIVSCVAAAKGPEFTSMAIGNAIGSVSVNTGFIMGLALLFMPMAIRRKEIGIKGFLMVFSVAVLTFLCWDGALTTVEAILVLLLFVAFLAENLYSSSQQKDASEREKVDKSKLAKNVVIFIFGAAALAFGSTLLVDNGEFLAKSVGISDRVIAITLVAIGTSLPELVTAITAIRKKQGLMSVGNILGANIIDITVILPVCALISGGTLRAENLASIHIDMPVCLIEVALAVIPTLILKKFSRWQAAAMVVLYVGYIAYSIATMA